MNSNAEIATEFNAFASALEAASPVEHLTAAQRAVLNAIPPATHCGLDVGCGTVSSHELLRPAASGMDSARAL